MVQPNYNPFRKGEAIQTEHGIISNETRRYFTHRKPEHVFKKYQAFAISTSELEICYDQHVDNIVIKYHGNKENTLYRIPLEHLKYMKRHNNKGDEQVIIPIKDLTIIGKEKQPRNEEHEN